MTGERKHDGNIGKEVLAQHPFLCLGGTRYRVTIRYTKTPFVRVSAPRLLAQTHEKLPPGGAFGSGPTMPASVVAEQHGIGGFAAVIDDANIKDGARSAGALAAVSRQPHVGFRHRSVLGISGGALRVLRTANIHHGHNTLAATLLPSHTR